MTTTRIRLSPSGPFQTIESDDLCVVKSSDHPTFNSAVAAAEVVNWSVALCPGSSEVVADLTTSVDIIHQGGTINVPLGIAVHLNGTISAAMNAHLFTGAGDVWVSQSAVRPEMWGAAPAPAFSDWALQQAWNNACNNSGAAILGGTYKTQTRITTPAGTQMVALVGDSAVRNQGGSCSIYFVLEDGPEPLFAAESVDGIRFEDVDLWNAAPVEGPLLSLEGSGNFKLLNCKLQDNSQRLIGPERCTTLLRLQNCAAGNIARCRFVGGQVNVKGVDDPTTDTNFSTGITFVGCWFIGASFMALRNPGNDWNFVSCIWGPRADYTGKRPGAIDITAYPTSRGCGRNINILGGYAADAYAVGSDAPGDDRAWFRPQGAGWNFYGLTCFGIDGDGVQYTGIEPASAIDGLVIMGGLAGGDGPWSSFEVGSARDTVKCQIGGTGRRGGDGVLCENEHYPWEWETLHGCNADINYSSPSPAKLIWRREADLRQVHFRIVCTETIAGTDPPTFELGISNGTTTLTTYYADSAAFAASGTAGDVFEIWSDIPRGYDVIATIDPGATPTGDAGAFNVWANC